MQGEDIRSAAAGASADRSRGRGGLDGGGSVRLCRGSGRSLGKAMAREPKAPELRTRMAVLRWQPPFSPIMILSDR